jgi:tyrosyl-tRNA synthetase
MYHGENEAEAAEKAFENLFVKKDIPDDMPEVQVSDSSMKIIDLMVLCKTADSKGAARRLVQGGGVSIDGEKIADPFYEVSLDGEKVLKVGKRKFVKIVK